MPFGFGRCKRRGRGKAFGERETSPLAANCICPKCGAIALHQPGLPCFQTKCPRCNSPMVRQFFDGHL